MPDLPAFIGRYRVVERLSSGGMGVLYLARDPAIDRTVAIKVARVSSVELRERFLREARATGRLNHRNIVTIYDVGEHDGEPFIAMEYVPGRTLGEIIRRKTPLPLPERLQMLRELCEGLAYAHGQGIVHRDVKPANLIARDATGALTILDFGIARLADAMTTAGAVIGTPHYMAPEQITGTNIDHRCDIFSVGLVFYELLSYRRAFDADTPTAVLYKIVHEQPAPLVELAPEAGPKVVALVERALAKQVDDRYQDLGELLADLDGATGAVEDEDRELAATLALRPDDEAGTPADGRTRTGRAELLARREAQLKGHLRTANAALKKDRCDAAQAAAEQAALLDPDDARVLKLFEHIGAARLARQVEQHLSNARGHLEDAALTKASESVESVLQLQPKSQAALPLRREIEARRTINRGLEKAERSLAAGELTAASDAVREVLALDGEHVAALTLKERIAAVARDHRARATVEEARANRTAGDLAAAQAILEGFDEAHDDVSAELAAVKTEIRQRCESFEALMAQARRHLEHGNLQDARDPVRQALAALAVAEPGASAGLTAAPEPADEPSSPAPPEDTVAFDATRHGEPAPDDAGRRRRLVAILGSAAVVTAIAVAGAMWSSSFGPDGQESGRAARRDAVAPVGGARTTPHETPVASVGSDLGGLELAARGDNAGPAGGTRTAASETPAATAVETDPDSGDAGARTDSTLPATPPAAGSSPAADPDPPPPAAATSPPPPAPRTGPDVDQLLADAAVAEVAGDYGVALDLFDAVLRRETGNQRALAGRGRVEATRIRTAVEESLRAGDAAFAAGRYEDARRLFQDALDLDASPAAAEGLRRVDNVEAVLCPDHAACGTLVIRVTPTAEIFVDDRSLGAATSLVLRVSAGRHRVRLETANWRFPRALEVAGGETSELVVDLERDGFPR